MAAPRAKVLLFIVMASLAIFLALAPATAPAQEVARSRGGVIQGTLTLPAYEIVQAGGGQMIRLDAAAGTTGGAGGAASPGRPGQPGLPAVIGRYALPANVEEGSVVLDAGEIAWTDLPGTYDIVPVPIPAAAAREGIVTALPRGREIVAGRDTGVYGADAYFPPRALALSAVSQSRKWKFVEVEFCPFSYNAATGRLRVARAADFTITFDTHGARGAEKRLLSDGAFDERLLPTLANCPEARAWYRADGGGLPQASVPDGQAAAPATEEPVVPAASAHADYVIITTNAVRAASAQMSNFVAMKANQGFTVMVADESAWGGGTGSAASLNIRAWLKNNYAALGIENVLLIGNPDPASGTVPMRMCWPRHGSGSDEQSPTDYYYADLTGNWDLDGDGYFGEYSGDFGAGGVDKAPEVYVGRIPYYGTISDLDAILQKLIVYETATGNLAWRKNGLIAAAISNYANEDRSGWTRVDGVSWGNALQANIFTPAAGASYKLYEKAGLTPVAESCDAPLTRDNFVNAWNAGYGFVVWWAHGSSSAAARKYWSADDGDGVPEGGEMAWVNFIASGDCASIAAAAYPIVVQVSCDNGWPESSSNLGYSILRRGSIGTNSASRVSWYGIGTWATSWSAYGDNASYGYYIPQKMLSGGMTLGEANHWCRQNFGSGFGAESFMNVCDFNVYGDPSLSLIPTVKVSTTEMPGGSVGAPYSQALSAVGGTAPYSWAVVSGALPGGLSLSAAGVVSGTPSAAGAASFTVRVTDSGYTPNTDSQALSITVTGAPLAITTAALPDAALDAPYAQTLSATGGQPPYAWSLQSGSLPAGLALSSSGAITGTPSAVGTAGFTVLATDSALPAHGTDTQGLSIAVAAPLPLDIATTTLPNGMLGAAYSQTLSATGGTAAYAWAVISGSLPAGLALDASTGAISGTPTTAGLASFVARVTDSHAPAATDSQGLSITIQATLLDIKTSALPHGTTAMAYGATMLASGGVEPYTWAVQSGTLPPGLSLAASTGAITGTPSAAGSCLFVVRATDSLAPTPTTDTQVLTLSVVSSSLSITTTSLPAGLVGAAYSQTLQRTTTAGPYSWTIESGPLPPGLGLQFRTGALSGTPTTLGTYDFVVRLEDDNGDLDFQPLYIIIANFAGPDIDPTARPAGRVDVAYSTTFAATGGTQPYSWAIDSGEAPAGLALSGATLSGTPSAYGSFTFAMKATDAASQTDLQSFTIIVAPAKVAVVTMSLPNGTSGEAYGQGLIASGGLAPYSWTVVSGALPARMTLEAGTGVISGTPSALGAYSCTVRATDSQAAPDSAEADLQLVVDAATRAYTLARGYNIVCLPFANSGIATAEDIAAAIGADCRGVSRLDTLQYWQTHTPGNVDNDFAVAPGAALMVKMANAGAFATHGDPANPAYAIARGYTLITLPKNVLSTYTDEALCQSLGANCKSVSRLDPLQYWDSHIPGQETNFNVQVYGGYMVKSIAAYAWPAW